MRKVLIITYYWPPSGGSPVLRWLRFSKYARQYGWEPIIFTVENAEYPETDPSLELDIPQGLRVMRKNAPTPYQLYKTLTGQKKSAKLQTGFLSEKKKPSALESISIWIRGNFFIPDAKMFWINPSVRFLSEWLKKNPVDLIVSTGPPHSCHRIAYKLKKKYPIKWIADFRDPWTKIDFYSKLKLTRFADQRHHRMEREVIQSADVVTTIGWQMAEEFRNLGAKKVEVITNGFDTSDFGDQQSAPDPEFVILHTGSINKDRNPVEFFQVIKQMMEEDAQFASLCQLRFIGKMDYTVQEKLSELGLNSSVQKIDFIPHKKIPRELARATVLLLPLNKTANAKGILTGKLFEYLASGKTILALGPPDGDAARVLKETGSGKMIPFHDISLLKESLKELFQLYLEQKHHQTNTEVRKYSWLHLSGKFCTLFNSILES